MGSKLKENEVDKSKLDMLYFDGVKVSDNYMTGRMDSTELIASFDNKSWIPFYQRERILNTTKINKLKEIFKNNEHIDCIKLNFMGKYDYDSKSQEAVLHGRFHVIDGQQRLWALKESGATNIKIPVELYLNLNIDEEIKLFHRYNKEGTNLTFGELAKSTKGSFADIMRGLNKKKDLPIRVTINNNKLGLPMSAACMLVFGISRVLEGSPIKGRSSGKRLLRFLEEAHSERHTQITEFIFKQMTKEYVETFGEFDSRSTVYKRSFFIAWNKVILDNFLQNTGKFEFGKFDKKLKIIGTTVVRNSRVLEIVHGSGGDQSMVDIYNKIVETFNHKLKHGRLLAFEERYTEIKPNGRLSSKYEYDDMDGQVELNS